jgi:hypothetical protein
VSLSSRAPSLLREPISHTKSSATHRGDNGATRHHGATRTDRYTLHLNQIHGEQVEVGMVTAT